MGKRVRLATHLTGSVPGDFPPRPLMLNHLQGPFFAEQNLFEYRIHTVNPALLASSFVWQIQLSLLHISLFKVTKRKYFSQGKWEFMKFLFVLLDNIKILTF
jgi:hypothetical protein